MERGSQGEGEGKGEDIMGGRRDGATTRSACSVKGEEGKGEEGKGGNLKARGQSCMPPLLQPTQIL